MNIVETELPEKSGVEVQTACGDAIELKPDTPMAMFNRRPVYFCQVECKASFEDNPLNSCLADNIREQSG